MSSTNASPSSRVSDPVADIDNDDEFRQASLDRWPKDSGTYLMGHKSGVLVFAKAADTEEARRLSEEFVLAQQQQVASPGVVYAMVEARKAVRS